MMVKALLGLRSNICAAFSKHLKQHISTRHIEMFSEVWLPLLSPSGFVQTAGLIVQFGYFGKSNPVF